MGAWPLITVSRSCLLGGVGQQRLVLSHAVAHLEFAFHLPMSFAAWRVMFLLYPGLVSHLLGLSLPLEVPGRLASNPH